MLKQHRSEILGKLLGIRQQSFGMRCWDHVCAVSSDAVINRDTMPTAISELLGSVDLCCTNIVQQYIGSHININASDTILA